MNDTDKPTVEVNLQKLLVASGGVLPKRLFVVKEGEGTKNIEIYALLCSLPDDLVSKIDDAHGCG